MKQATAGRNSIRRPAGADRHRLLAIMALHRQRVEAHSIRSGAYLLVWHRALVRERFCEGDDCASERNEMIRSVSDDCRRTMATMAETKAKAQQRPGRRAVFTIGHSTRPIDEFIALLRSNGIERLIDVRTIPKSRHNQQFNEDSLARALPRAKIDYIHIKELGGLRHARRDSPNTGWHNASFRGYADYMQTEEFRRALDRAIELADEKTSALMCAEAVPWRCHRSLIADALLVRGIEVLDIVGASPPKPHKLTPFARVRGTEITYPPESGELFGAPQAGWNELPAGGRSRAKPQKPSTKRRKA